MKKYSFQELMQYVRTGSCPAEIRKAYDKYEPKEDEAVLDREFLGQVCRRYGLDGQKEKRLFSALDEIEKNPVLSELYKFLAWDLCQERNRSDNDFYLDFDFCFQSEYPDCRKFLLLLSCVVPSEKDLVSRKIPKGCYEGIPESRLEPQMKKYRETGDCSVDDFPWDKNFYTRAIYLFDRFYFIPYQFADPFHLYRNVNTGEVTGIYNGGYAVLGDGQLAGEKVREEDVAFRTFFREDEEKIEGTYMNPCGFLSEEIRTLSKREWKEALRPGDSMLAFHIPAGEGYTPYHVQKSMQMAVDFYGKYFPEIKTKGFWSESWLYDNRLSFLLSEESNIVSVQRRFYNYSIGGDDSMIKSRIWGEKSCDILKVRTKTTLEKKVQEALMEGNHFCTTSMIVLKEEIPRIEAGFPYIKAADLQELGQTVQALWKKRG